MLDERNLPDISHYPLCRRMMLWHFLNPVIRIVATFVVGFFNIFFLSFESVKVGTILFYGSMILYAIVLVMAFLCLKNRLPLTIAMICILGVGCISRLIFYVLGVPLALLYVWQIMEIKQRAWLKQQIGYPVFKKRLTIQEFGIIEQRAKEEEIQSVLHATAAPPDAMTEISADPDALEQMQQTTKWEMPDAENSFVPNQL